MEIAIHDVGVQGEGVGSIDSFTVFVPGALPEEIVKARLSVIKKNYAIATLVEVVKPSAWRIAPICPLFGRCGGCQLMHLQYDGQLEVKRRRVASALERIGRIKEVEVLPCRPSPLSLAYRNKIQLPAAMGADGIVLGLFAYNSHEIVAVDRCYIHCDLGEKVFHTLKELLRAESITAYNGANGTGSLRYLLIKSAVVRQQVMVIFVSAISSTAAYEKVAYKLMQQHLEVVSAFHNYNKAAGNVILGHKYTKLYGQDRIEESLCGMTFSLSPGAFFQVNTLQAEQLYRTAIALAELKSDDTVLDLYCGVGILSILVAPFVAGVVGIEYVAGAIQDAKDNAKKAKIANCRFICGKTEELLKREKKADVAFVNPPRKGCEAAVIEALLVLQPRAIVYISCDPATLARDLYLLSAGGYEILQAHPFDMFPQTMHVETIVCCRRKNIPTTQQEKI